MRSGLRRWDGPRRHVAAPRYDLDGALSRCAATRLEIVDGLLEDAEDIYPDAVARAVAATWRTDPKALERELSTFGPTGAAGGS